MLKKIFNFVILPIGILFLIAAYLFNNPKYGLYLSNIKYGYLLLIFILQFINILFNIIINKIIFSEKKEINWFTCSYTTSLSMLMNYIIPFKAGSVFQAAYLKKKHDLPLSWFTSTFIAVTLIMIVFSAILGIVSLTIVSEKFNISYPFVFLFYLFVITFVFVLPAFTKIFNKIFENTRFKYIKRLKIIINRINDGYITLAKNRKLLQKIILINLLTLFNLFLISYIQFKSIGAETHFYSVGLFLSIYVLSILINITPGSIGLREIFQIMTARVLMLNSDQIIAISVLDRLSFLVAVVFCIVIIVFYKFFKEIKNN